jgi:protease II
LNYCRIPVGSTDEEKLETVLDIVDDLVSIGFVPHHLLKTTVVDKIKMNDDHSKIAFTVDIGNTERCTGGIKDMKTGKVSHKIENISQMEFVKGGDLLVVEMDENNRPYCVKRVNKETGELTSLFVDDD